MMKIECNNKILRLTINGQIYEPLIKIESEAIRYIYYDEKASILIIVFHASSIYKYYLVPKHIYEKLMKAGSKGEHHREFFYKKYLYKRLYKH